MFFEVLYVPKKGHKGHEALHKVHKEKVSFNSIRRDLKIIMVVVFKAKDAK